MMVRITLTYFLIFITSGFHLGVKGDKPWMTPKRKELIIQDGDELRIECHSKNRVHFSRQILSTNVAHSECLTVNDSNHGKYTLFCPHVNRTDTGWYGCAEEGIEIKNDEQVIDHSSDDINWIYVYVNSSLPFAIMEALYDTVTIVAGGDGVIPCRPTSPNLTVTLISLEGYELPENMTYDPKIGFIVREVGKNRAGSTYSCELHETSQHNNAAWPSYGLTVAAAHLTEPPIIDKDELRHVVPGQNLTLKCSITVSYDNSGFHLKWRAPDSVPKNRLHHFEMEMINSIGTQQTWQVQLTINNIEQSDGGKYICFARTHGSDDEEESSVNIEIWDPSVTYVNLTVEGLSDIVSNETNIAQWRIMIKTYPDEYDLKWFRSDETEIVDFGIGDTESDKYSLTKTGMWYIFRISKLELKDSGQYIIRVNTSEQVSSITLKLTVEAPPKVSIDSRLSPYARGEAAIISCNVLASPLPKMTHWTYIEYPNYPSKEISVNRSLTEIKGNKVIRPYQLLSGLNITLNGTGDVMCRSCNKFDCAEDTKLITVSDTDIFNIRGPKVVAEGDNVTLTCKVSRQNFTDKISWRLPNPDQRRNHQSNEITDQTVRLVLEILDVSKSDAGAYFCKAESKTSGNKMENHTLSVETAREPKIIRTNFNGSKIFIKYKDIRNNVTLKCVVIGVPRPLITWHRDDVLLTRDNQYEFSDSNFNLHIRFFGDKDSGRYSCRAENRLGNASHFFDIKIEERPHSQSKSNIIWISMICVLIVIIIIVITYMGIKVHRERILEKQLREAGLTHFEEGALESLNPDLTLDDQVELLPYDKKWEFPRELLKLGKQLGSGAFGVVMKAEAQGIIVEGEVSTVAVKMVRRSADPSYMKALSSELKIMIHLGRHMNVVNLLGACTKTILTKRELYVIVEYCRFGNLHNYLQRHRDSFINQIDPSSQKIDPTFGMDRLDARNSVGSQNKSKYTQRSLSASGSVNSSDSNYGIQLVDYRLGQDSVEINMSPDGGILSNNSAQPGWRSNYRGDYKDQNLKPISTQDLLCWAWQVSCGMNYLSARNVLHGDLAARNILLADNNIVKICDFGLAKNMYKDNNYKKRGDSPLPIKWMAIESIRDRIFSTQSDVWSFGIVLWEFFTLARTPYPGMEAEKQYDRLLDGYRLEKPEFATKEIYDFMLNCWQEDPSLRPSFPELAERIGSLLTEGVKAHFSNLNTPYMNMNIEALQNGQSDYLTMMSAPNHRHFNSHNPPVEVHGDPAYVSMNRVKQSNQFDDLSPRSDLEESHSNFPSDNQNAVINTESEDCHDATTPMLTIEDDPHTTPVTNRRNKTESINRDDEQYRSGIGSGYRNFAANSPYANLGKNQSSAVYQNLAKIKSQLDNANESSPSAINGNDNRGNNIPNQKTPNIFKDDVANSYTNPGYVLMSNKQLNADK